MTTFRELHRKGDPLVMINVWDMGSAKLMQSLGAKALATSSAAHAYILGRVDGGSITRDEALAHAQDIVSATPLPVQGDFENGFGDDPQTCAETVRLSAEIGLAGICIEDTLFSGEGAYEFDLAVERIQAAASAARALKNDFVLTARADGIMTGQYDTKEACRRIRAFDKAGADCLYAPFPPSLEAQTEIIAATDKPVNALVAGEFVNCTRVDFAKIGVGRISIGSSLASVTQKIIHDAGKAMIEEGVFSDLANDLDYEVITRVLGE